MENIQYPEKKQNLVQIRSSVVAVEIDKNIEAETRA